MNRSFVSLLTALSLVIVTLPSVAAPPTADYAWCGTHPARLEVVLAKHELFERRNRARARAAAMDALPGRRAQLTAPRVSQQGDVVIIEDNGTIVHDPNEQDLSGRGVRFKNRRRKGIKLTRTGGGINEPLGERVALGDDDSQRIDFPRGFKFKFFGTTYKSAYVNSDGNITFGAADSAFATRELGRLLTGPARVMAIYTDLDPSAGGEIYVRFSGPTMQITWVNVPEFDASNSNTFQVTLFKKGHVELRFDNIDAENGIVGISPGGSASVELVDITQDPPATIPKQAIAEVFGRERIVDETGVIKTFYDHYQDNAEQIIIFYGFPQQLAGGDIAAYHFTVKNGVRGIGYKNYRSDELFDHSGWFGSRGRLEGFSNMGYVDKWPDDLTVDAAPAGPLSSLEILVHEIGHQWLFRSFFHNDGGSSPDLQEDRAHWSFNVDTDGSFMQGNEIRDNGDGSFQTFLVPPVFNPVDLYMLGLVPPEDVPGFFYVDNTDSNPRQVPQGAVLFGDREEVTIDQILREEGARDPSSDESQKDYHAAVVLVFDQGRAVEQALVDKAQEFVDLFEPEWSRQTGGRGSFDLTPSPK